MKIDELIAIFRTHLFLPDPGPVEIVMATIAANLLPGDPVWLLLVGPPASGKTELLSALSELKVTYEVSTFTEAGLLSGSVSRKEGATGGLLAELNKFGIIVCKDFTSVLSESADTRNGLLAALREIYDGAWVRRLGSEGGRTLCWVGKAGLLAAVTETIDRHTAAMGAMGERFVLYRMPELDDDERLEQGRTAMRNAGHQVAMREVLAHAVNDFVSGLTMPGEPPVLTHTEQERLTLLADLATRCRSIVERSSGWDREIELVPQSEALGRLQAALTQLLRGMKVIGLDAVETDRLLVSVALDGMTKARRSVVELLVTSAPGVSYSTAKIGDKLGMETGPIAKALADLAGHNVVERIAEPGSAHSWQASDWLRRRWGDVSLAD